MIPVRSALLAALALFAISPSLHAQSIPVQLDPKEADLLGPTEKLTRTPAIDQGSPVDKEEAERFRVLRSSMRPEKRSQEELKLRALEGFLDYDDEEGILYNPQRTQIIYGKIFMEADRVIIDNRLREVQAEGNVIFRSTDEQDLGNEIHAQSFRYNFSENEGVAFGVSGQYGPVYFKTEPPKTPQEAKIPPFQQVSKEESLFRNTSVTTCDFKVPHYRIRAREVILFQGDRIFFRGATFYTMEVPILYLPYYTRSMRLSSPWFVSLGTGSSTGARIRIGYQYEHETKEPKFGKEDEYETRSSGRAQVFADIMEKRGFGAGVNYNYQFDFERHKGEFQAYAVDDFERTVKESDLQPKDDGSAESQRWQILWKNRSQVTDHLSATINVDYFSDPEIFDDIIDRFVDNEFQRERVPERRARAAIAYQREAFVARLLVELKERIGIDRYGDFSKPTDNDNDFDFDPGKKLDDSDSNSVAHDRWGRVSEKLPELTVATRYLPLGKMPLFLLSDIKAYNNLDKGINTVDSRDDAWVRGVDAYHQLLWQYRITERYVLLAKIGAGVGVADRDDTDLALKISELQSEDSIDLIDDDGTFRIGRKKHNLDDIESFYAYADASLRFNARFSDALTGYIEWRYRQTTEDFVGDFYAKIGDYTSREDLFDYRLREHWLVGNLNYALLHPSLSLFLNGGANLIGHGDRFPNEEVGYWNTGIRWANRRQTLRMTSSVGQSLRQIMAPTDPAEGEQTVTTYRMALDYSPIHGRWYTRIVADHSSVSGEKFEDSNSDEFTFFTDEDTRTRFTLVYGRELGPKWNTEVRLQWDDRVQGLREISWLLQRDLHDAIAVMKIRSRQSIEDVDSREENKSEKDISFGLKFKMPGQDLSFGPNDIKTLQQRERQPVVAY